MFEPSYISTFLNGKFATIGINRQESVRNLCKIAMKRHRQLFPKTGIATIIDAVDLTKIRVLRQDAKIYGQLESGSFVWLVTENEWNIYVSNLVKEEKIPTRYGRSLPLRFPSSLSPIQLREFIDHFCNTNKLTLEKNGVLRDHLGLEIMSSPKVYSTDVISDREVEYGTCGNEVENQSDSCYLHFDDKDLNDGLNDMTETNNQIDNKYEELRPITEEVTELNDDVMNNHLLRLDDLNCSDLIEDEVIGANDSHTPPSFNEIHPTVSIEENNLHIDDIEEFDDVTHGDCNNSSNMLHQDELIPREPLTVAPHMSPSITASSVSPPTDQGRSKESFLGQLLGCVDENDVNDAFSGSEGSICDSDCDVEESVSQYSTAEAVSNNSYPHSPSNSLPDDMQSNGSHDRNKEDKTISDVKAIPYAFVSGSQWACTQLDKNAEIFNNNHCEKDPSNPLALQEVWMHLYVITYLIFKD